MNSIKKSSFLEILFVAVVFTLAATYSYFIGSKGFSGFDLSPMISIAQSLHQGNGFHDFIDNPFSPGFALILKFFSQILGGVSWNTFTFSVISLLVFVYSLQAISILNQIIQTELYSIHFFWF